MHLTEGMHTMMWEHGGGLGADQEAPQDTMSQLVVEKGGHSRKRGTKVAKLCQCQRTLYIGFQIPKCLIITPN